MKMRCLLLAMLAALPGEAVLAAPAGKAKPKADAAATTPAIDTKVVSGMSIVGNNEAPKSLYIVPWKSSELARETTLDSSLLDEELVPVDRPVFARELEFYRIRHTGP